jgi:hypothetical protein
MSKAKCGYFSDAKNQLQGNIPLKECDYLPVRETLPNKHILLLKNAVTLFGNWQVSTSVFITDCEASIYLYCIFRYNILYVNSKYVAISVYIHNLLHINRLLKQLHKK